AVDPHDRKQISRGAGQEGFARRLRLLDAERALDQPVAFALNDVEDGGAGDAVEDRMVGGAGNDAVIGGHDPGVGRGPFGYLPVVVDLPSLVCARLARLLLAE